MGFYQKQRGITCSDSILRKILVKLDHTLANDERPLTNDQIAESSNGSCLFGSPPKRWGQRTLKMYYTYILFSLKSGILYCGSSADLKQRVEDHNAGKGGTYTRKHRPYKLVFYEAFLAEKDALNQEQFYKSGYGREVLKEKIKNSLEKVKQL